MKKIIEQYVDHLNLRNASPHTIRNYRSDINQFCDCAAERGFDPLKLDRVTVRIYLNHLREKYSQPQTIMRKRDAVKSFYRYLREEKLVARNPFDYLERVRIEPKPPPFLNETDAAHLLDAIKANPVLCEVKPGGNGALLTRRAEAEFLALRDKALLESIYSSGLRAAEVVGLNWIDIDFRAGFLRVNQGKGRKDRIVPIGEMAIDALWIYGKAYHDRFKMEPRGANPIFLSRNRRRITTRQLHRVVTLRMKLAGIEVKMGPHGLRHSFATHLLQNGGDLVTIAECLGHQSFSNTQKYTHLALVDIVNAYNIAHPRA